MINQRGAGLIEVLIAIVITAFTLLGLAGLQVAALRYQKVAHYRAIATAYSGNLAERVRANLAGARGGFYSPASELYPGASNALSQAPICINPRACSHAEIATLDLYEWRAALAHAMAGGWGEIYGSVRNGFAVTVYFREPGHEANIQSPRQANRGDALSGDSYRHNANVRAQNKTHCRTAALNLLTDQNVRCFMTVFTP
ncbi:type IV pilus modification protein PilV [Glaciimonas immobilis]|uniref:Type IV pilus assembly protein PilV n=1 Tax=Glaciimonas immobilis TaxID=728004 RepID=A0A840RN56_9BURK|nr:type IV pilus modification protein PilV [Glaciimonas immobilis]MBB5199757.1 type IV pilus assembly protein PilV [Glaciimonas immobilis]